MPSPISAADSHAFMATFELPPTGNGPLDGLTFGVKDLIDIAGYKTGCGNPTWLDTHPPAVVHAVCVEQLLKNGGRFVGKTVTDQLAFSLLGDNHFYGTPLNPRAPDRVPGGSSSGSASAVACGLADFALGTDTGGSVRVPSSNCGIWGLRPSHGIISVAGVNPFAPTFDTVGILARSADVLARAAHVLLAAEPVDTDEPKNAWIVRDAFELADQEVRDALAPAVQQLRDRWGKRVQETTLAEIDGMTDVPIFAKWCETYCVVQWAEIKSTLGSWVADVKPDFGEAIAGSFKMTDDLDRNRVPVAIEHREHAYRRLKKLLGPRDLLCLPTTPALAPLKGQAVPRSAAGNYYPRALGLTSIAGLGRLPQVSMPLGESNGVPLGLSIIGAHDEDAFVLKVAESVSA